MDKPKDVTLEEVINLARRLSPVDQVRLIEQVAPDLERALTVGRPARRPSLFGALKDLGPAPSAEAIDEARRDAWSHFPGC